LIDDVPKVIDNPPFDEGTAKVDAEITPESAGTTCVNLLFTVVNITDEAYTTLAPYDTDGN
jgi:hypothetical protein